MATATATHPGIGRLPATPGVYRFRDAQSRVLYIGRATSLRSRVGSYWGDLGDRRHLARMVRAVTRIEAVACDSVHEAAWLERNLLEERKPRWNRTAGGQETPCYLLLDPGPRTPGLRMVHRPGVGRLFGPYLGGTRARQAISGLHRVHPLAYAGEGLTGAERAMAAQRGVHPGDRTGLVAALAAVLEHDPAAVAHAVAALAQARDRAAQDLAFERAGRLQEATRPCTAGRTGCWSVSRSVTAGCASGASDGVRPARQPSGWRRARPAGRLSPGETRSWPRPSADGTPMAGNESPLEHEYVRHAAATHSTLLDLLTHWQPRLPDLAPPRWDWSRLARRGRCRSAGTRRTGRVGTGSRRRRPRR
jgi:excinuclease ABC subunit C